MRWQQTLPPPWIEADVLRYKTTPEIKDDSEKEARRKLKIFIARFSVTSLSKPLMHIHRNMQMQLQAGNKDNSQVCHQLLASLESQGLPLYPGGGGIKQ